MIEPLQDIQSADDADVESDAIDFVPDPAQLARVRREPATSPRWLIAALAAGATVTAVLALRPGPATANAAATVSVPQAAIETPPHQPLFVLPEWHDDDAPAKPAAR